MVKQPIRRAGKQVRWQWDNGSARPIGAGLCISATQDDFRLVAAYLLQYALRFPDDELAERTLKNNVAFDKPLREAAQHIGLQMLAAPGVCGDGADVPTIFRPSPSNFCEIQQSIDGGATWTLAFDLAICQPAPPIIPPQPQFRPTPGAPGSMQVSYDNGATWLLALNAPPAPTFPPFPTIPTPPPMIRFRQSGYLLQQSLDGGATWTTAYDYSELSQGVGDTNYYQNTQIINNYLEIWNNNPTVNNFAPEMVFDGSTDDETRDRAICYAVGVWYDAVRAAAVTYVASQNDGLAAFSSASVAAGVSMVGTPVAGIIAGAIVGALVKGISLLGAGSQEANYTAARDEIICCMYDGLKGQTITRARFQAAVSACGFAAGSNTEAIRIVVAALLQDLEVYLTFLRAAAEGFKFGEFAELPACGCVDDPGGENPDPGAQRVTFGPRNTGNPIAATFRGRFGDYDEWDIESSPIYGGVYSNWDMISTPENLVWQSVAPLGTNPTSYNMQLRRPDNSLAFNNDGQITAAAGLTLNTNASNFGYHATGSRHAFRVRVKAAT